MSRASLSIQSEAKEVKFSHHAHNESLITQVQPAQRSKENTLEEETLEARDASIIHDGFAIKEMSSVVLGVGTQTSRKSLIMVESEAQLPRYAHRTVEMGTSPIHPNQVERNVYNMYSSDEEEAEHSMT